MAAGRASRVRECSPSAARGDLLRIDLGSSSACRFAAPTESPARNVRHVLAIVARYTYLKVQVAFFDHLLRLVSQDLCLFQEVLELLFGRLQLLLQVFFVRAFAATVTGRELEVARVVTYLAPHVLPRSGQFEILSEVD